MGYQDGKEQMNNQLTELEYELRRTIEDAYADEDDAQYLADNGCDEMDEDAIDDEINELNNSAQYLWNCAEDLKLQIEEIKGHKISLEDYTNT
jgi:hypothetical protein